MSFFPHTLPLFYLGCQRWTSKWGQCHEGWWAPYRPERVHRLHSLSKSFTATAIGLLVSEGRLNVEDRMVSLFTDALPTTVDEHLAAMRVHDLLTMRTGHAEDPTGTVVKAPDGDWVRAFLAQPVTLPPGTHSVYNSAATFMLSALVQRLTGETLLDYLRPRLLEPLGLGEARWITNPQGINVGGWGLYLTTEGIARFGQFYLQRGCWEGEQMLPEAWVDEATRAQVPPGEDEASDWAQGYGFQFWRCRFDAYRADGAFGQLCVVMPQQEAVLTITAGVQNMQRVLDHVWTHLLAGMDEHGAWPEDPGTLETLCARCATLRLDRPKTTDETGDEWRATLLDETYTFGPNEAQLRRARLIAGFTSCRLMVTDNWSEHTIDFGLTTWDESKTTLWAGSEETILARAGWTQEGTLGLEVLFIEGGFHWSSVIDKAAGVLTTWLPLTGGLEEEPLLARRDDANEAGGSTQQQEGMAYRGGSG
ncbi:hypothetical protein DAETH_42290 (plasmid) [Deinococcus aetherius]|uniref:Beta-lactamase-related domain-containing protein n=1 Tax=Deinococcus aetherius TaxID=200252 RepID=A0ABN6RLR4_9DEIO|nr:serine hydrolase [Deinococcus aetherius]BDP44260.1 hypothetical protein DAETH_42290 [Deinococcus aetherius]